MNLLLNWAKNHKAYWEKSLPLLESGKMRIYSSSNNGKKKDITQEEITFRKDKINELDNLISKFENND